MIQWRVFESPSLGAPLPPRNLRGDQQGRIPGHDAFTLCQVIAAEYGLFNQPHRVNNGHG
ncbi:MAG: hypothetical protein C7B47_17805 [Sulfobacillus thermosulfidooxidans]|uniref:Uncharacterized protein n=1 Tax=Sulfobacillus thermosulfidooxidans TaxID=28034 RepID=A0A2T2WEQ8_SULTH|nr:MAG: hypothetical protein C7B47_17805 [Sulfobacillus thermosulfidooxidans]